VQDKLAKYFDFSYSFGVDFTYLKLRGRWMVSY